MPSVLRGSRGAPLALAVLLFGSQAAAQEERSDARAAYDDAARAYEAKDFPRAARGFARADALAPNALALKLALAAAVQAGDPVLAEELAVRAERRDASADVQELARSAHRFAKGRVGTIRIACSGTPTCTAEIGGRKLRDGETIIALRGPVVVAFTSAEGRASRVDVDVPEGGLAIASEPSPLATAPPRAASAAPREPPAASGSGGAKGLPPVFFWLGVGATSALTGATIASGIDSNARYDDFAAARTVETRENGRASELRTNVLLGGAIVAALATTAVGLWFTRWGAGAEQ